MNTTLQDELMGYANELGFGEFHIKLDKATDLCAIVAIHSTKRGPALGGCRCIEYPSTGAAIKDALRLARGMSYKAAMADLPLGGGKAVLIKPKQINDRDAYFTAFGRFVEELGGRYITAVDSGTNTTDMDFVSKVTSFATSTSDQNGDPSPYTAQGVFNGIKAAIKSKLQKDNLQGLHVAIQGVGNVGYRLAKLLHAEGVKLTICDHDPNLVKRCVDDLGATAVDLDKIYAVECDIFAPCALGAILNEQTIPQLKTKIVAGAANNQLADPHHDKMLHERGILYAPDYVINAGGLIYVYTKYANTPAEEADKRVEQIYDTLINIFARADKMLKPTGEIADLIAAEQL